MKILWVKSDFLHPTSRGGQIRTLETIRRLHARHEVHYVGFGKEGEPEGVARAGEYCSYAYPVKSEALEKNSPKFALQALMNLPSSVPLSARRWATPTMKRTIADLRSRIGFDAVVCDFLHPCLNFDTLDGCVLFQHNVETMIWRRHAEHASDALRRAYFGHEAKRMFELERKKCLEAAHVIAVSDVDAQMMRDMFGVRRITAVPTGVDTEYFDRPSDMAAPSSDLVFVGSMDWMPNVDGVHYFVREILPLIRKQRPSCSLTVVGRKPSRDILALAEADPLIRVTGTVPDVRPHLWDARVSIVPLRIGGGTRLKIYESMAAGVPVVSTTVGAEGLNIDHPVNIRIADDAENFAAQCLDVLTNRDEARRMSDTALHMVRSKFGWDQIAQRFEDILAGVASSRAAAV